MTDSLEALEPPTVETTLAVVLGASEYPQKPTWTNPVLGTSARAVRDYLRSSAGLAMRPAQLLDLFDAPDGPPDQLLQIAAFLNTTGARARDLIVYYVGHGSFDHDDYCLGIRATQRDREFISTIESRKLARIIREGFARKRVYVILDSCFAASAARDWMGDEIAVAVRKMSQPLPREGTAFLAAASKYDVARAPREARYTVFTGAVLDALTSGVDRAQPRLSLHDVYEEVRARLQSQVSDSDAKPELHAPSQQEGDVSRLELFPNAAYQRFVEAQRVRAEAARAKVEVRDAAAAAEILETADAAGAHDDARAHDDAARATDDARVDEATDAANPGALAAGTLLAPEKLTGADRIVVGDNAVDFAAPTIRPEPQAWPMTGTSPLGSGWTMPPAQEARRAAPGNEPPSYAAHAVALPSPGTFVAAAPDAPDPAPAPGRRIMPPVGVAGTAVASAEWAAPATPTTTGAVPSGLPSGDWMNVLDPEARDRWTEPLQLVPLHAVGDEAPPVAAPSLVANAQPLDSAPRCPTPRSDGLPAAEPKVQVDPTLIESLKPMPSDGPLRPMASDGSQRPVPHEEPFRNAAASSQELPSDGALPPATAAGDSGSGLVDPRYPSHPTMRAQGWRLVMLVIVSALSAAMIGGMVQLLLDPGPSDQEPDRPGHAQAPGGSATDPIPAPAAPAVPTGPSPVPRDTKPIEPAAGSAAAAAAAAAAPQALTCFADITSQPPGAEIVIDDTNVVGTTPQKIELPCGGPTEIVIRKPRMAAVTRRVTPSPEGVGVRVTLARLTFLIKVSSTPQGATVTVNGKSLGVTPTTVKVPAFEPSTLAIAKDGYAPETEKVTPKMSGVEVHSVLKRLNPKYHTAPQPGSGAPPTSP